MQELSHFVNGENVAGASGRFADVFNPATGEVQSQCPMASVAETTAAIEQAAAAQPAIARSRLHRR